MARDLWRNVQTPTMTCQAPGMLSSAIGHWKTCCGDLSRAMDTISSGETVLETIFSFQPDQVEVFVNTEGAPAEDIGLRVCPEEGGFELSVNHHDSSLQGMVRREVRRLYSFQRPLRWDQAKATVTSEGILHVIVPGPQILNIDPCF